jgi:hypothetical protein
MANISNFKDPVTGVSYSYDMESRNPLADKNIKKAVEVDLVYNKDTNAPTEVIEDNN